MAVLSLQRVWSRAVAVLSLRVVVAAARTMLVTMLSLRVRVAVLVLGLRHGLLLRGVAVGAAADPQPFTFVNLRLRFVKKHTVKSRAAGHARSGEFYMTRGGGDIGRDAPRSESGLVRPDAAIAGASHPSRALHISTNLHSPAPPVTSTGARASPDSENI